MESRTESKRIKFYVLDKIPSRNATVSKSQGQIEEKGVMREGTIRWIKYTFYINFEKDEVVQFISVVGLVRFRN